MLMATFVPTRFLGFVATKRARTVVQGSIRVVYILLFFRKNSTLSERFTKKVIHFEEKFVDRSK